MEAVSETAVYGLIPLWGMARLLRIAPVTAIKRHGPRNSRMSQVLRGPVGLRVSG